MVTSKELFEILVREHAAMLAVYLRSVVRDPAQADDLFQETMLTAWRTLDRFDRSRPFGPWLRGIAAKLVLAAQRKSAAGWLLCDEQVLEHLDQRGVGALLPYHAEHGSRHSGRPVHVHAHLHEAGYDLLDLRFGRPFFHYDYHGVSILHDPRVVMTFG